jgi:hypothetical protein
VLAVAGSNVDVRDAVPSIPAASLSVEGHVLATTAEEAVDGALTEALRFLDAFVDQGLTLTSA